MEAEAEDKVKTTAYTRSLSYPYCRDGRTMWSRRQRSKMRRRKRREG